MNETTITYTVNIGDRPPAVGEYLVSFGKRGVGSVYLIRAVSKVRHKTVRDGQSYRLAVRRLPDLKPYVVYDNDPVNQTYQTWVRGVEAWPCIWMPRGKS